MLWTSGQNRNMTKPVRSDFHLQFLSKFSQPIFKNTCSALDLEYKFSPRVSDTSNKNTSIAWEMLTLKNIMFVWQFNNQTQSNFREIYVSIIMKGKNIFQVNSSRTAQMMEGAKIMMIRMKQGEHLSHPPGCQFNQTNRTSA